MLNFIKKRIDVIARFRPFSKKLNKYLIVSFISGIVIMALGILSPYLYKMLINDVIIGKQLSKLWFIVIGFSVIYLLSLLFEILKRYTSNKFFNKLVYNIRLKILKNYLGMDLEKYNKYQIGELKLRIDDDTNVIEVFYTQQLFDFSSALISQAVYFVILLTISWKLSLISFIIIPVTIYLGTYFGKKQRTFALQKRKLVGIRDEWMHNSFQNWKEIKALAIEDSEDEKFDNYFHDIVNYDAKIMYSNYFQDILVPILKDEIAMKYLLYFIGGIFVMNGSLTIGSILIFMKFFNNFYDNINIISKCNSKYFVDKPFLDRMFEMAYIDNNRDSGSRKIKFSDEIKFKDVSFCYNDDMGDVLKNITFDVKNKETLAIVGRSGSGKTTIAKLMMGINKADKGEVLIDGINVDSIDEHNLHKNIGVVMQDSILFNLTIRENLKLAKIRASDAEIMQACRLANIDEMIEHMPGKLDTLIGEKGIILSGGQKQRLAIARVFLSGAPIIIFDEATSALDHESEKAIHEAIINLKKSRTVIIIAHRLSSILISDRVLVIDKGEIVGNDTCKNLLGQNQVYDDLFKEQYIIA